MSSVVNMPSQRRRKLVSRRRRHDDEGEEEGSIAEDPDNYSISDGSVSTTAEDDGDVIASDTTGDDETLQKVDSSAEGKQTQPQASDSSFKPSTETQAMLNGLKLADGEQSEELQFDASVFHEQSQSTDALKSAEEPPSRSRSDYQDYVAQRESNPAFVPNRGGFFLHDDRNRGPPANHLGSQRGRGRGFNPGFGRGHGMPFNQPTDRPWAHDLHDSVNKTDLSPASDPPPNADPKPTNGPNRSFSTTTVLGKITVQVFLPGMEDKKNYPDVMKKHYTLLPQHRPPLRRDKPVRISIPDEHPRYIFPSTERSFIFIPRALRPNQQVFRGGRGRGSWHGSRRNSLYGGGSIHSPSVAMSRKSSMGASATGSGVQTPTMIPGMPQMINRPIVRMPMMNPATIPGIPMGNEMYGSFPPEAAPIIHSPSASLPMHQPRPQKTVSLAGIESPTIKAPQQQYEQPFHQQMPSNMSYDQSQQGQPKMNQGTPLAHIPEGAVYAQPFQPYPMMPPGYYGMPYGNGMFMPQTTEGMGYVMPLGGPVAPNLMHQHYPTSGENQLAHESNGMVYYYDSNGAILNQYHVPNNGMMGMMPAPQFFYSPVPNAMFYPQQSGQ